MKTLKKVWLRCLQLLILVFITSVVSAQLHADFTSTPIAGCPPMVVTFSDNSTGNPTSWKWDLGNGTISFLKNPIVTYFNPGSYNIKLTISNASGTDSIIKNQFITIYALPTVKFSSSDTVGCFPLRVNFTDSSLPGSGTIASWQWDFGDGNLSNDQHPTHVYTNAGSYTVILRVVNSNGCSNVITKTAHIKTQTGVNAGFNFTSNSGCTTPATVTFNNSSTGTGALTYNWNFGDGGTSTLANPTHSYTSGSYTVTLIVANNTGCVDTITKTGAVNVGAVQAKMNGADTICASGFLTLNNVSVPSTFLSTTWTMSNGMKGTGTTFKKVIDVAGTYQVKMVTDFGSCSDSVIKNVVVLPKPVPSFTSSNSVGCSAPLTVNFTNTSIGGVKYQWNFGDFSAGFTPTISHTYTATGSYSVLLFVTDAFGCTSELKKDNLVKIAPPKISSIKNLPAKGCLPLTITPTAVIKDSVPVTDYLWNFGDGVTSTAANPSHTYTTAGIFNVTLIITTAPGCTDTLRLDSAVMAGTKPSVNFTATPREVCPSIAVTFTDLTTNGPVNEWHWEFGDGGTSTEQHPSYNYSDTGYFNVTLIASNFGCSDTLKVEKYIHVLPPIANFDTTFECSNPFKRNFIDSSIGANSWDWNFGDGTTSTVKNPSHVYANAGTYTVTLIVTNGACTHTKKMVVIIVNEKGKLNASDTVSCIRSIMNFAVTNVNPANISTYTWFPSGINGTDSVSTSDSTNTQYYTTAGSRLVAVVLTDVLGCRDTITTIAPINIYGPAANFGSNYKNTCFGTTINFSDTVKTDGVHPIASYTWNFGEGGSQTFASGPFTHNYSSAGLFNVTMIVKDTYGCSDTVSKPGMISITRPVAKFVPSDTMLCPTSTLTFDNQSQGSNAVYAWSFGDGNTSADFTPTHTYGQAGAYTIKLLVTDKNSCVDSTSVNINVFSSKALFSMSDSFSTCPPLVVNITNQSSNYIDMFWDFGDGGNSKNLNPSHIYTYPGTYTVKLVVKNNGGCVDSLIKKVVIDGPSGNFDYVPKKLCNPGAVQYTLVSTNTIKYIWDFDDGTAIFSGNSTATHTYTVPGVYLPKIILENAAGCKVPVVGLDTVRVLGIETNILSNTKLMCDSGIVSFRDSTITNDLPVGMMWSFGDGSTSTQPNPTHVYTQTGTYTVSLVASSDFGCKDTAVAPNYIKIVGAPKISITGDTSGCEPAKLKFSAQMLQPDTSVVKWTWTFGNGNTSNVQSPDSQAYTIVGSYPITVKATNSSGCSTQLVKTAVIHPKPTIDAGAGKSICKFSTDTLHATGGATYLWTANPTISCTTCPNPVVKPAATTTYYVKGISAFGCSNSDSVTIAVKQPFKLNVSKGDTICIGKTVSLSATGADSYQWSPSLWLNNANISAPSSKPDTTITYQVVGRDNAGCFKDSGKVTIKVFKNPSVDITNGAAMQLQVGQSAKLITKASNDVVGYSWSPNQWLSCSSCPDPIMAPKDNITYMVAVKNAGNCVATDKITVTMLCNDGNIFVPNTFSPNGDGANDAFYPRGAGVNTIRSFKIFNRWGQCVFEKTGVSANKPEYGWDGKLNGVLQPTDVYVYIFEVICANNVIFPIKGNVTLIR